MESVNDIKCCTEGNAQPTGTIATVGCNWVVETGALSDIIKLSLDEDDAGSYSQLEKVQLKPPHNDKASRCCQINVNLQTMLQTRASSHPLLQVDSIIAITSARQAEVRVGTEYAGTFSGAPLEDGLFAIEATTKKCFKKVAGELSLKLFGFSEQYNATILLIDIQGQAVEADHVVPNQGLQMPPFLMASLMSSMRAVDQSFSPVSNPPTRMPTHSTYHEPHVANSPSQLQPTREPRRQAARVDSESLTATRVKDSSSYTNSTPVSSNSCAPLPATILKPGCEDHSVNMPIKAKVKQTAADEVGQASAQCSARDEFEDRFNQSLKAMEARLTLLVADHAKQLQDHLDRRLDEILARLDSASA